jgi:lipoprotein-anchoring transpeptidase ErfK/SrfK
MTTNSPETNHRNTRSLLFALLIGALMLILTLCAALTITPSIAGTFVGVSSPTARPLSWSVAEIAKPTYTPALVVHPLSWSVAEIAKPTFTPYPLPAFTSTPEDPPTSIPSPTNTSSPLTMNIVEDSGGAASGAQIYSSKPLNSVQSYSGGKYILVSISQQHLTAYENDQVVYSFIASTGMGNSTRIGTFSVLDKIPNAYGATWNIWMPNWLGIYWAGSLEDGIHALPILPSGDRLWSGYLGTPISFGCVVLGVDESLQLYNWVDVGTPVVIKW